MTQKSWLVMALLGYSCSVTATASLTPDNSIFKQKIEQAITDFQQTHKKDWAYQVTRYENEEGEITSSVEHYTPSLSVKNQWKLISISGEEPTTKQQNKFIKSKHEQINNKEKNADYSVKLRELINLDSLQWLSDNDSHIQMSFQVSLKKLGEDAEGKLQGTLSYNKQHKFIEEIIIVNNAEFSPMFSASISDLAITFNFIKIKEAILPLKHELHMKGRFAYIYPIDEVSTDTYSNYEYKNKSD